MNSDLPDTSAAAQIGHLDWRETMREMHLKCAAAWVDSARYWRGEAAKFLTSENNVLAAEALLNAVIRETYAEEEFVKAQQFRKTANDLSVGEFKRQLQSAGSIRELQRLSNSWFAVATHGDDREQLRAEFCRRWDELSGTALKPHHD